MAKATKKVGALKNAAGKKPAIRTGRKAGESQLDFVTVPDPPKPTVKR